MRKNFKKFILFLLLLPLIVQAQGGDEFMGKVEALVGILIKIVFVISVIELVFAGVLFATAEGDPERVRRAKNIILYAVIGIGVAAFAWALAKWVYGELTK